MNRIWAFILGVIDFRSSYTLNLDSEGLQSEYDWGREWAHRLTLRFFEGA